MQYMSCLFDRVYRYIHINIRIDRNKNRLLELRSNPNTQHNYNTHNQTYSPPLSTAVILVFKCSIVLVSVSPISRRRLTTAILSGDFWIMRRNQNNNNNNNKKKSETNNNNSNGFLPNSFKLISSCIKTVSSNVRSASASVAGSIAADSDHLKKDQVYPFHLSSTSFYSLESPYFSIPLIVRILALLV